MRETDAASAAVFKRPAGLYHLAAGSSAGQLPLRLRPVGPGQPAACESLKRKRRGPRRIMAMRGQNRRPGGATDGEGAAGRRAWRVPPPHVSSNRVFDFECKRCKCFDGFSTSAASFGMGVGDGGTHRKLGLGAVSWCAVQCRSVTHCRRQEEEIAQRVRAFSWKRGKILEQKI